MEHTCPKCDVLMVEGELDHAGPFRIYKKEGQKGLFGPKTDKITNLTQFVCPKCGLVEFYVEYPQKFQ
ncbi:hypothetical protein CVD25_10010 [Bacillus canaveralius]|uniref:Nucleic acid-binding protein n=1 Tax=Bacillus canaveralius TaxID=1403243 RepID=A0A2N5GMH0_9BACI|nr:hypothetical protein CU633_04370 [Bacillus sp. V3-13]PLR83024.1 hypothetical protein CU635_11190 [Bacillus canaveralius]PLR96972.1 hypothetical protein CVD25_10010 [Bacillus canaveralius]